MSIADHFDHAPDAGFVRSYDSQAARRQFQISLVLILILTLAAFALGLLVRFDEPAGSNAPAPATHDVHFAVASTDLQG
ncbi:MAG TPA: hypothetical protein VKV77_01670 [Methylovirgula sp.]|nr:hypothetical protein [Methylovirgula sp.]